MSLVFLLICFFVVWLLSFDIGMLCFLCNDPATTEIYTYLHTLSRHDALPILPSPLASIRSNMRPPPCGGCAAASAGSARPSEAAIQIAVFTSFPQIGRAHV